MNRIIVAGGTGFIGSHLVKLLDENNEVFILDANIKTSLFSSYMNFTK